MKRGSIVLASLLLVTGCATTSQVLDPGKFYKRDMQISIGDMSAVGVAVVPASAAYQLKLRSSGKLDLLTATTCHREIAVQGLSSNQGSIPYNPVAGIERDVYCPLELGGYDRTKGRHSWGIVDFETPDAKLPATLKCNGAVLESSGVSICQSHAGLVQRIEFKEAVRVAGNSACEMPKCMGQVCDITLTLGECVYAFKGASGLVHRLTTIGYESILMRDE